MFVSGKIKSANFTGDIKLIQAKYVYDQEKEFNSNTIDGHILVAPHHGGDYGKKARSYSQPTTDVVISVGAGNSYGHPENICYLICKNFVATTLIGLIKTGM